MAMLVEANGVRLVEGVEALIQEASNYLVNSPWQTFYARVRNCSVNDWQEFVDNLPEIYVAEFVPRPGKSVIRVEVEHEFLGRVDEALSTYLRLSKQPGTLPRTFCLRHYGFNACRHAGITVTC
jgi:hypothetical protein